MNKPHKHAALIKAWADGAEIEVYSSRLVRWQPLLAKYPAWNESLDYRIKPKEPVIKYLYTYIDSGGDMSLCRADIPLKNNGVRLSFDPDSGELLSVEKI